MNIQLSIHGVKIESLVQDIWLQYADQSISITLENGCSMCFTGEVAFNKIHRALFFPDSGYVKVHTRCVDGHEETIRARIYPVEFKCPKCRGDVQVTSTKIID